MLMSIREFLTECRATIRLNKNPRVKRLHDTFIMDHIMYSNLSRQKINMVNKVRLYLQVETVSDISNSDGNKIDKSWLQEGQKPSTSTGLWPDIKKPSEKMWKAWRAAVKILTHGDGNLRQQLGRWVHVPEGRKYKWMQDKVSIFNV